MLLKMLKSDLPKDAKVLKAKWVFKKKQDGRYKSRYTAKGCQQRFGYDYDEVFSPVVRYTTLRSLSPTDFSRPRGFCSTPGSTFWYFFKKIVT